MRIIRAASLEPQPWRNGAGTTGLIHAESTWQVSVAELRDEAEFSLFEGHDRVFTLIGGQGATLEFAGRSPLPCFPLVPALFPGDLLARYRPAGGPARAFNVISVRDAVRARVWVSSFTGAHRALFEASVIFCVEGRIAVGGEVLEAGDTALLPQDHSEEANGEGVAICTSLYVVSEGVKR